MGIKIKGLKIRNFRCIGSLDLDLTDPDGNPLDLVVLAGPNGCGKTSVLEAILIVCGHKQLMVASAENPLGNVKVGADNFEIKADALIDSKYISFQSQIEYDFEADHLNGKPVISEGNSYAIYVHRHHEGRIPITYFSSWRRPKLVGALPIIAGKKTECPAATEENRLWSIKQTLLNEFAHSLSNGQSSFADNISLAQNQRLNEAWRIFCSERVRKLTVEPESVDSDERFDLFFTTWDGVRIPVDQLSSGEIEFLTMACWFTMNDYRGGIVLIDEPEMHMHVHKHRAIMRALRVLLPETQIIVATHSWDILKSAMSYERFMLLREGNPGTTMES